MIIALYRNLVRVATLALTYTLPTLATVRGAEIKVVTSGAFTAAYLELVPEIEHATHNKLVTEFGPSMGTTHNAIPMRLGRGEAIDVVIMAAPAPEGLIKEGKVRGDKTCRFGPLQNRYGCQGWSAQARH